MTWKAYDRVPEETATVGLICMPVSRKYYRITFSLGGRAEPLYDKGAMMTYQRHPSQQAS